MDTLVKCTLSNMQLQILNNNSSINAASEFWWKILKQIEFSDVA